MEKSQKNQDTKFWQVILTNRKISITERNDLANTFNLRSVHILNSIINTRNHSRRMLGMYNVCKNLFLIAEPMHAVEKSGALLQLVSAYLPSSPNKSKLIGSFFNLLDEEKLSTRYHYSSCIGMLL